MTTRDAASAQPLYHGTKADLSPGDLIVPGFAFNFGSRRNAVWVYVTATLDAATWGAELALGEGRGRIYVVEPTGPLEDDPNLTDKKFPGNPTKSYRTREPVRVVDEVADWQGHPPAQLEAMRARVAELARLGVEAIEDRAAAACGAGLRGNSPPSRGFSRRAASALRDRP